VTNDKAHVIFCVLCQDVNQATCSAIFNSSVPPRGTWKFPFAAVYYYLLSTYTLCSSQRGAFLSTGGPLNWGRKTKSRSKLESEADFRCALSSTKPQIKLLFSKKTVASLLL